MANPLTRCLSLSLLLCAASSLAQQAPAYPRPFPNGAPPGYRPTPGTPGFQRGPHAPPPAEGVNQEAVPAPRPTPQPQTSRGERQISPSVPTAEQLALKPAPGGKRTPTCEEVRNQKRYTILFDKVDIEKLVQTVADVTCKTFILGANINGKISIIGPGNGTTAVDADQFYAAFLAALDVNNLSVYSHGKFLKIVEKRNAKQTPIPVASPDEEYTENEQMVTKLFKLRFSDIDPVRNAIQGMISPGGDIIPFPPDTLIVNDLGSNIHRLEKIIDQLDTKEANDEIRVIPIRFAAAQDVANTIQKIFENKGGRPGRGNMPQPFIGGDRPGMPTPAAGVESSGPVTLSQIIPDERTNKLIVVASPAAFARIESLINQIDIPISGEGRINVYDLANANAEDLASTLQGLTQGSGNRSAKYFPGAPPPQPGGKQGVSTAELFSGEVKISPDKATNSLVIVASQADYRNLVRVIEQLDIPRRQVFVEAVIMEVNLDHTTQFGLSLHQGFPLHTPEGDAAGVAATKYSTTTGLPPSFSVTNLANFGGFLAGIQGPALNIPALQNLGINIPSFGIVLHALQNDSDVNVLSTPHLLTSDNEEAEITVGQNVPFQAGFAPGSMGLGGLTGGLPGTTTPGVTPSVNPLSFGFGGLSSFYAPIQRQNVELKLSIKPQINASDYIRMVINEQTEEIASRDPTLGPTTSKRTAKTTVVAKDQETVVIGGIMQERTIESAAKVPVLGDLPLVGHLFRETTHEKIKTNLLLFLTPYIIRDQSDFRRIFERKMAERQRFVEEFYGQVSGYDVAVDWGRKAGPLQKLNQDVGLQESKAENGGPGLPGEQIIKPTWDAPTTSPQSAPSEQAPGSPQPPPAPGMPPPPVQRFGPHGWRPGMGEGPMPPNRYPESNQIRPPD